MLDKKIGRTAFLAIIIVIVIGAGSVGGYYFYYVAPSGERRSIKIGLVAPYSIAVGQDMDRAAKMAVAEINAAGGIYVSEWRTKVLVELVIADTKDDAPSSDALAAVTKAVINDKVDLLVGGFGSSGTLANQVVAVENRVPYIITGASTHLVTRRGPQGNYGGLPEGSTTRITDAEGMSYMFHYCTTTYHYSKTVVHFFAEVMKPVVAPNRNFRLAILYRDDAFGGGVVGASKSFITSDNLPIDVVAEVKYPITSTTWQAYLTTIKASKPDAVYVVDFTAQTAEIIREGQKDVGLNTEYIAVECCEEPEFYSLLGEWGKYQLLESKFASYAGPPFYLPTIDTYVAAYKARYNTIPGMMGADTYDAIYIAKDAIERAGSVNKAKVRTAIESTNLNQMLIMTQTGKIQFSTAADTYHEIAPVTFVEQLFWNTNVNECRPKVIYPQTAPIVGTLNQTTFQLPSTYTPGSP